MDLWPEVDVLHLESSAFLEHFSHFLNVRTIETNDGSTIRRMMPKRQPVFSLIRRKNECVNGNRRQQ